MDKLDKKDAEFLLQILKGYRVSINVPLENIEAESARLAQETALRYQIVKAKLENIAGDK